MHSEFKGIPSLFQTPTLYINSENVKSEQMSQKFTCRDLNTFTHASFTSEPSLIHIWAMTHSHLSNDLFTFDSWLIHIWAMTHSQMSHESFTFEPWRIHSNDSSYKSAMEWATQFFTQSVRAWVCVCACVCVCVCVCVSRSVLFAWEQMPWVMTHRYLSHDSFICMSLGIRHSTFAWSRPHTFA